MKEEGPQKRKAAGSGGRGKPPSRKLSFPSRVRNSLRAATNRLLEADRFWSAVFIVVVVLLLGVQRWGPSYEKLVVGTVAERDIKAPFDIEYVDEAITEENRRKAREEVLDVYTFDVARGDEFAARLTEVFDDGRRMLEDPPPAEDEELQAVRPLADRVPAAALEVLSEHHFESALERELIAALTGQLGGKVVGNKSLLEQERAITLNYQDTSERVDDYGTFLDVSQARDRVRKQVAARIELSAKDEKILADLAASYVDANVFYDPNATERLREAAAESTPQNIKRVAQGDVLIRKGEPLTPEVIDRIESARQAATGSLDAPEFLGLVIIACMMAFFLYRYTRYHQRAFKKLAHLHSLLVLMIVSMLVMSRGLLWLARAVTDNLEAPFDQLSSYMYLIPLGAGAILVALLANGRIATVYSAFVAVLFGATNRWDPYGMMWAMLVQCAGVYAISTYRERAALLRAGLVVGGAGAVSAMALEVLRGKLDPFPGGLYASSLAFVGGAVGVGLLISFSLPLLESLFNVLTDIRLLELSNVNNPLLAELMVKAPGSYNHSLVVGNLAEEGARAIGANALFCRVAAFYHDVGKMLKPEYYVENQRGSNPHDRLSPSMSALIIASHVKDGVRLAREAGLPEQIVAIIPQHHGTKLMTYFYEKAKNSADPSLGPVKEEDFRYPGPKPQTREAAIFMLADAVEAAARTIDDPTPNRLKEMIRKVCGSIVMSGELEACDLTFADLDKIQEAFLRCLVSMHHHRVDYPGFDFRKPKGDSRSEPKSIKEHRERRVARSS